MEKLLGQGAMGDVYLAEDTQLSRKVALKIPKLDTSDSDERLERFYREARLAATVRNPYLCPVYDVGEIAGVHYIAMAFIDGKPLSEVIKSSGRQKERAALILIRKVAVALNEAHAAGIVHRDLKPANIMIDARGEPVVMDFGLAFQADENRERLTESGTILGSPAYMSPEQLDGSLKVTPVSDQFSLGVVLYELLTAELPFRGSISAIANQIINGAPPSPSKLRPDLDLKTEQLCLKLLAKRPLSRFASMQDVAQAVATALKVEPSSSASASREADAVDDAPASCTSIQQQVERLVSWGELVSALEVLEAEGVKLTGKQAEWARKKRSEIRSQIERWEQEIPAQCNLGRQLISKFDYSEAVNVLSAVPVGVRDAELTSLLSVAKQKADEVEQLLKDLERVFRTGTDDELSWLVKRFLQLKPGHQQMKALAEDLKRYGPERVIQKRSKQKNFLDPAGRIWEPTHCLYYAVGVAAACTLLYLATIIFQTPTGTVAIEVFDPTISIDFAQQRISSANSGQSVSLKAGEKHMLAVRLGGELVPDWVQDLSVERNEIKRVSARMVDGNVELTINSERKIFQSRSKPDPLATASTSTNPFAAGLQAPPQTIPPTVTIVAKTETSKPAVVAQAAAPAGDFIVDLDFRKSAEGMSIADQHFILEEHKNSEFRYLGKKLGWWYAPFHQALWRDENNNLRSFAVEFDVRIAAPKKGEFAVEFGRLGDDTISLCFNQLGQLRLVWAGQDLVPPTASPQLKPVDQFNTVRMEVRNRTITVAVNNARLFEKKLDRLAGRHVNPWLHVEEFPFDVRLQRFRLERLGTPELRQFDGAIRRFEGHTDVIRGVAFLPSGKQALSVSNDSTFKLWDVSTGSLLHDFPGHTAAATCLSLSADGKRAMTGCDDGIVRLWDLEARQLIKALKGHSDAVSSVLISKEGLIGYSASHDGSIRRWDLKSFSKPTVLPGPGGEGTLTYSTDEKLVAASAMDGSIAIRGSKAAGSIVGNDPGPIRAMAFTPDGSKLVAAGCVSALRVWDVSNGKQIHSFEGDDAGFASLAITNDGKFVVAGCRDCTIRAWNLETGDAVVTLRAPVPVTYRMALSPDNETVLSGGDGGNRSDYALRLWHLPRL
ncbi:Serine/threonine-protein kinase PrkC [Caulifigura coniformis]|uniref:Serine/threonine-protein kinase PrkC n=1 Tax=Caulifigura coniformis TaxID=2527983 RepID=A0A517SA79_9PLAN|nr:serine/threonine-protein kinase [Caulifigura coniformis]QDT53032.1 Serine/threonine-protein kinase PrkC [Caulifigura coniformis]